MIRKVLVNTESSLTQDQEAGLWMADHENNLYHQGNIGHAPNPTVHHGNLRERHTGNLM